MVKIDESKCIGCGICANICPEGIEMIEGKAVIKDANAGCLKEAADACPRRAIILEGENEPRESNKDTKTEFNQRLGQRTGRGLGAGRGRGLGIGPRDGRGQGRGGGGRRKW